MPSLSTPELNTQRARIAALSAARRADDPTLVAARQQFVVDQLVDHVEDIARTSAPLSPSQRDAILAAFAGFRVA